MQNYNAYFLIYIFMKIFHFLLMLYSFYIIKSDVRQKANLTEFVEFKMAHKAAETTCKALDLGTHEHIMKWYAVMVQEVWQKRQKL